MITLKKILFKIMTHSSAIALFVCIFPILLFKTLLTSFWKVFGAGIVGFFILVGLNFTLEECLAGAGTVGFIVNLYWTYKNEKTQ
jgi:hypothetical protein